MIDQKQVKSSMDYDYTTGALNEDINETTHKNIGSSNNISFKDEVQSRHNKLRNRSSQ